MEDYEGERLVPWSTWRHKLCASYRHSDRPEGTRRSLCNWRATLCSSVIGFKKLGVLYVCVYTCFCVCVYVCMYTHIQAYTHACWWVHTYVIPQGQGLTEPRVSSLTVSSRDLLLSAFFPPARMTAPKMCSLGCPQTPSPSASFSLAFPYQHALPQSSVTSFLRAPSPALLQFEVTQNLHQPQFEKWKQSISDEVTVPNVTTCLKIRRLGDISVNKVLAVQEQGPKFNSKHSKAQSHSLLIYLSNPSAVDAETGRSLRLHGQLTLPTWWFPGPRESEALSQWSKPDCSWSPHAQMRMPAQEHIRAYTWTYHIHTTKYIF